MTKDVEARSGEVSTLLCSSDALLVEAREIDDLFSQMLASRICCRDESAVGMSDEPTNTYDVHEASSLRNGHPAEMDSDSPLGGINWKGIILLPIYYSPM